MTIEASVQLCDCDLATWQLVHIHDCIVLGSRYHLLLSSHLAFDMQSQWGNQLGRS